MTAKKTTTRRTRTTTNAGTTGVVTVEGQPRPVSNGLSDAILGFRPDSNQQGTQVSQVDTLFKNNRWYLVSNMRQVLSQIYIEHGLVQTIVDVPVDDAFRGGVEIVSKQLSPEQVEELQTDLEREDILNSVVGQGQKWNRLFGGGGIIIMTDQDPETELDIEAIGADSPLEFRAVDLWELYYDRENEEGVTAGQTGPLMRDTDLYTYYGKKIHKTRVMRMRGLTAPSMLRPRLRGWGVSVVETLVRSINQYLKSNNVAFEVLDEFKLDIFKIAGLTNTLLSADGTTSVTKRIQLANYQKNFQNALTMDADDDYQQKQLSFAGLADVMKEIRMQVASDMRMPLTKLFGISSAGFNAGEDDIENYNAMVESQVRAKSKYEILRVLELKCQKKFGFIPEDLKISFKPLRVLSSTDEETVKTQKFTRLLQARQAGEISTKEFKDACNKDALLPVQLDTSQDTLDAEEEEGGQWDQQEGEDGGQGTDVNGKHTVTAEEGNQ